MATVRPYINHLLQNSGITPACSEEERAAAEDIAKIFSDHGFEPEVQEFTASGASKIVSAGLGVIVFIGAVLMGTGGALGLVGLLLAVAGAVFFTMERTGRNVLSGIGAGGLSQNVIAYHKASGPLASPRNRPVVVVAHYDSPRGDIMSQAPYVAYRPLLVKLLPYAMLAPGVISVVRLLPIPDGAKVVLWIVAIVFAFVPLVNAVAIIMNRAVLPYTSGSVCNKSSVAAMLGVMEAVAPYRGANEFPNDIPFDEFFAEQRRVADEIAYEQAQAQAAAVAEAEQMAAQQEAAAMDEVPVVPVAEDEVPAATAEPGLGAPVDEAPADEVDLGATVEVSLDEVEAASTVATEMPLEGATTAMPRIEDAVLAGAEAALDSLDVVDVAPEAADAEPVEIEPAPDLAPADMPSPEAGNVPEPESSPEPEPQEPSIINAHGCYRHGEEAIRQLGMVPGTCVIEYEVPEPEPAPAPEPEPVAPVPSAEAAPAAPAEEQPPVEEDAQSEPVEDDYDFAPLDQMNDEYPYGDDVDANGRIDTEGYHTNVPHRGIIRPARPSQPSGLAAAFSQVSESAARFFDVARRRGKEAIDTLESAARKVTGDDEREEEVAEALIEEEAVEAGNGPAMPAAPVDALDTATAPADDAEASPADGEMPVDAPAPDAPAEPTSEDASAPVEDAAGTVADKPSPADEAAPADAAGTAKSAPDELDATIAAPAPGETAPGELDATQESTRAMDMSQMMGDVEKTLSAEPASPAGSESRIETVDSLMAEITSAHPAPRSIPRTIPDPQHPSVYQMQTTNRASLFDLPDPAQEPSDPFAPQPSVNPGVAQPQQAGSAPAERQASFDVIDGAAADAPAGQQAFETISADSAMTAAPEPKRRRGLGGLFGRKKKEEPSMGELLGLGDDFDAKKDGRDIGSWDNFEDDDWKGGATGDADVSEDELRDAVTSMGDDELMGHDIWFVATGASEYGNAGIKAFLATHRDKLRGVFLINLECIGAGQVMMVSSEGERRVLKGDKRIMNLVRKVSAAFHNEYGAVDMPYVSTDAYAAMSMSLRSLTIAGIDGPRFACARTPEDAAYNVDVENINMVADVVTEVIRRS